MAQKMKTFKDLVFKPKDTGGTWSGFHFDNAYGVSVIAGAGSYSTPGTYELAVLLRGRITYDTPITNDVLGHLTPKEVSKILKQIQSFDPV